MDIFSYFNFRHNRINPFRFYWKSAEVTLLQEKPKFASVMTSGDDLQVEKAGKYIIYAFFFLEKVIPNNIYRHLLVVC